jgi:hypothetical protein
VTCCGCGEKGHVVRVCPKGRRQNQNGGRQKGRNDDDQGKTDTTPVASDNTPGSVGVNQLANNPIHLCINKHTNLWC